MIGKDPRRKARTRRALHQISQVLGPEPAGRKGTVQPSVFQVSNLGNVLMVQRGTVTEILTGEGTWTAPTDIVGDVTAKLIAAGGGGLNETVGTGGGGGGGGAFCQGTQTVAGGAMVSYNCGKGGYGGASSATASDGGNATFGTLLAAGGKAGAANTIGGLGGAAADCVGTIKRSGGAGGNGSSAGGGGGGGSAGHDNDGNIGTDADSGGAGGVAVGEGGAGGAGGGVGVSGADAQEPGGGGGGMGESDDLNNTLHGGNGANGRITLTYSIAGALISDWIDTTTVLVTSVKNVDGTLTISPTVGDVIASLNMAHANTWTGAQVFSVASPSGPWGSGTAHNERFGLGAGSNAATGDDNTFFGWGAGAALTSGIGNTCVGSSALGAVTTGGGNIAIGPSPFTMGFSLAVLTTGSNNVLIGYYADVATASTSDAIALGRLAVATGGSFDLGPYVAQQIFHTISSTGANRATAGVVISAVDNTDATRKYRAICYAFDTAARECWRAEGNGTVALLSFFGVAAVVQQTGDLGPGLVALGLFSGTPTFAAANLTGQVPVANGGTGSAIRFVDSVALTAQGADIAATNFTHGNVAGTYILGYSLEDTAADVTAGAVTLTIAYTDNAGATTKTATQVLTGLGRSDGVVYIRLNSGNISYAVSHTGLFGTAQYALYLDLQRIT